MGQLHGLIHIALHAGVALEIFVDIGRSRLGFNAQILGQAKAAHAVDQAKVDDLGIAALLAADFIHAHAKHFGGRGTVHVQAILKALSRASSPDRWAMMRSSICE